MVGKRRERERGGDDGAGLRRTRESSSVARDKRGKRRRTGERETKGIGRERRTERGSEEETKGRKGRRADVCNDIQIKYPPRCAAYGKPTRTLAVEAGGRRSQKERERERKHLYTECPGLTGCDAD